MYKLLNMADFCSNEELEKDMNYVKDVLNEGSKKARAIAIEKIKKPKEIVGLVGNIY